MIALLGLLAVSLVVLCPADPAYTCSTEEEGKVLDEIADWVANLPEDTEFIEGADALLAGGYDDHCKALHVALNGNSKMVPIKLAQEAKKMDEMLGHDIPRGMSKTLRDLVVILETHKSSSVASLQANSSIGRALRNEFITPKHLKTIKERMATMFRRNLQIPAQFASLCGKKKCLAGTKELTHALGIKGFKAKGVHLHVEKASSSMAESVAKWYRGQITSATAETEAANSNWASTMADAFGKGEVGGKKEGDHTVRGTRITIAKKWLNKMFFNTKPARRLERCYRDLMTTEVASNFKISREYLRIAARNDDKKAISMLCLELIRAEREKFVGVDEVYREEEL